MLRLRRCDSTGHARVDPRRPRSATGARRAAPAGRTGCTLRPAASAAEIRSKRLGEFKGYVKTYNDDKGYGFIELEEGLERLDVFFHITSCRPGEKPLDQAQVIFDCRPNPKKPGELMAVNVLMPRYGGAIKRIGARHYGFITPDDGGEDVFFHVAECRDFSPEVHCPVTFYLAKRGGGKDGPKALKVQPRSDVTSLQHSASAGTLGHVPGKGGHVPGKGSFGKVTHYDPSGWGLITDPDGQEVWFHVSRWGGKTPTVNARVTFEVQDRPGGRGSEAINIQVHEEKKSLFEPMDAHNLLPFEHVLAKANPKELGKGADARASGYNRLEIHSAWKINCSDEILMDFKRRKDQVEKELRTIKEAKFATKPFPTYKAELDFLGKQLGADESINEKILIHGTCADCVEKIAREGLDERHTHTTAFGGGIYLAETVNKTDQYATPGFKGDGKLGELLWPDKKGAPKDEVHFFLVCRTILGFPAVTQSTRGTAMRGAEEATCVPAGTQLFENSARRLLIPVPGIEPEVRYHSLLAETGESIERFREFVSFDRRLVLPVYLVAYHRRK